MQMKTYSQQIKTKLYTVYKKLTLSIQTQVKAGVLRQCGIDQRIDLINGTEWQAQKQAYANKSTNFEKGTKAIQWKKDSLQNKWFCNNQISI